MCRFYGVWRSLVARTAGGREVASSNLAAPIFLYDLYYEIQHSLQKWSSQTKSPAKQALFDLPSTLAIVSMAAPSMTPVWLKNADFSLFQPELKEFLLFLYTLHLRNVKNYAEVRATAQTAYILCANTNTFT